MNRIISGEYRGPFSVLHGQRGMLLSEDYRRISAESCGEIPVMVQWDDMDLWKSTCLNTGQGWEKHMLGHFKNFHCEEYDVQP